MGPPEERTSRVPPYLEPLRKSSNQLTRAKRKKHRSTSKKLRNSIVTFVSTTP